MKPYPFLADERPTFPGSPHTPPHPDTRRAAYYAIGLWIAVTAGLANAAVTVNVANLAGEASMYVAELSWLPAIYVAFNASANLLLVKSRMQFGVARVMRPLFVLYTLLAAAQILVPGFAAAIGLRAISGLVAAGESTLSLYYLIQGVSKEWRPAAVVVGLGMTQLATPLARLIPVDLLASNGWLGLHLIEFALVAITLAATQALPLPPGACTKQFEPLDFVTMALFLPAMVLLCGVVNRGRLAWWTDTPWLGVGLAVAIPLFALALMIETTRERPLLHLRWLGTFVVIRFTAVALLLRLALAEQTYGAVGLLTVTGLDDDQLRLLFACIALAMVLGTVVAAKTVSPTSNSILIALAALTIGMGAWLDSHANSLTRPEQLYLSQALLGLGTCLFIGPALVHGFLEVFRSGPNYFITLVVVFSITQNFGGLAGSALLGTLQTESARQHVAILQERVVVGDVQGTSRAGASAAALRGVITDPATRATQGGASLAGAIAREANTLAFNDVFRIVALLAFGTAAFVASNILLVAFRSRRAAVA
jgi:hypothetical protein